MFNESKMGNVIKLSRMAAYEEVLPDILEGLRDGSIQDMVIIAHRKLPEEERGCKYEVMKYWFGMSGSCVAVLGLLQYMIMEVQDYILTSDEGD